MPFSPTESCPNKTGDESWQAVYTEIIKPAVENSGFNYLCFRNDEVEHVGIIIKGIIKNRVAFVNHFDFSKLR